MSAPPLDVLVVGASYAGLQTALVLGRAGRRVALFDGGPSRNAPAAALTGFFGTPRPDVGGLLAACATAVEDLGVQCVRAGVSAARADPGGGFRAEDSAGTTWAARTIVLATGMRDVLPSTAGVRELWGRDVVGCPHCHGHEVRGRPLAVLGMRDRPDLGVARALLVSDWTDDLVLCTDGDEPGPADREALAARGIEVRTTAVTRLATRDGRLEGLVLADGTILDRRPVFVAFSLRAPDTLAEDLGCRTADTPSATGVVVTDERGATSVPGVWAAGTATTPGLLAIGAAGHGSLVATEVHRSLLRQP